MTALPVALPSLPLRQSRWPGLIAAVGGEASITRNMEQLGLTDSRWIAGLDIRDLTCDPEGGGAQLCDDDDPSYDFETVTSVAELPAFYVWQGVKCSVIGSDSREIDEIARNALNRSMSHRIEKVLWGDEYDFGVRHLASGDATVIGTGVPYLRALGQLQITGAACGQGDRLALHASPAVVTSWVATGAVRADGPVLVDAFGNVVIPGTGYSGDGPSGQEASDDSSWAYVTDVPRVFLDRETQTYDYLSRTRDPETEEPANVYHVVAYRAAAVGWNCCHGAVEVDLTSQDQGAS